MRNISNFEQLPNESNKAYRIRLYKNKDVYGLTNDKIGELCNLAFNVNYNESTHRKQVKYYLDGFEDGVSDCLIKGTNDDGYIKEMQIQQDELYKIKRQVADQRREYNKLLVGDARADNLTEHLIECANRMNLEYPLGFDRNTFDYSDREGLLAISDIHYGMTTDNIWNEYNTEIAKQRLRKLVTKTIGIIKLHKIRKIHIVLLGDAAHGAIHSSCRVASEEDVSDQLMHISEILAEVINEITNKVEETYVYSNYGNHLRTIQDKKDSVHTDNMEKLIPWWMKQRFAASENRNKIHIIDSDFYEFTKLNVLGYNICSVHGDLDNFKNLGLTVNTIFSKLYNETIDYTLSGDKHHLEEFEQYGIESILVRSLCGTDDYANNKRLYSNAGQTFMVFNKDDGRECTYNIKLN